MEGVNLEDYQVGVIGVTRKLTTIEFGMEFNAVHQLSSVSYTHLTLPTIYSV